MKVAYFTDTYKPQVNGITYSIDMYVRYLKKVGHSVLIYSPDYKVKNPIGIDDINLKTFFSLSLPSYKDIKIAFPNLYTILRDMIEFKPDVIHVQSPGNIGLAGMLISKVLKKPLVCTFHNHPSAFTKNIPLLSYTGEKVEKISQEIFWEILIKLFDSSDLIICPTEMIKNEILQRNPEDINKLTVLSNGITIDEFSPGDILKKKDSILYVGRVASEKSVDVLINAFELVLNKIPTANLTIVGDGPTKLKVMKLAEQKNLSKHITFTGYVAHEETINFYKESQVFVTPSPKEVQPMVVIEALACGVPVIGVQDSGVDTIVKDNITGFIVSKSDAVEISNTLINLLQNPEKIKELSNNARISAQNFDINVLGAELEILYLSVINENATK